MQNLKVDMPKEGLNPQLHDEDIDEVSVFSYLAVSRRLLFIDTRGGLCISPSLRCSVFTILNTGRHV